MATLDDARAAKEKVKQQLGGSSSVNGIGITRVGSGFGVKVNLSQEPPRGVDRGWATSVEGVPVTYEVVGTIKKLRARK